MNNSDYVKRMAEKDVFSAFFYEKNREIMQTDEKSR